MRVLNRTCQRSAWIIEDILYCHSGCLCWCAPCIRHSRALMQHLRFKTMEVLTILRDWDFKVLILWATVMLCNYKIKQCGAKSHLLWLYDPFNSKRKLARVEGKKAQATSPTSLQTRRKEQFIPINSIPWCSAEAEKMTKRKKVQLVGDLSDNVVMITWLSKYLDNCKALSN